MSVQSMSRDDASEATTTSWSSRSRHGSFGIDRDLLEAMGLSYTELEQLSAMSEEGTRAPVNSFESLGSGSADGPQSGVSSSARRSSLASFESSQENLRRMPFKEDHTSTEASSEATPPGERPSPTIASKLSLACVVALVIAFVAAFAYAVYLLRLNHNPTQEKKIVVPRSANDTGHSLG